MQGFNKVSLTKFQTYLLTFLIFIFTLVLHYTPFLKGFSPAMDTNNLVLAKNMCLTGQEAAENKLNIYISLDLIKDGQGIKATTKNQLTPLIYSKLFVILGKINKYTRKIASYKNYFRISSRYILRG